jgi:peptide/nickel transport system permease protein
MKAAATSSPLSADGAPTSAAAPIELPLSAGFWRRLLGRPVALASALFLLAVVLVAIGAPVLMPQDPNATSLTMANLGPSLGHWLGTDDLGRDVLSRVILGSRVSLLSALTAVVVALVVGVPLGLIGGYFGGWIDGAIMRANDALMSFPALMLAVTIVGIMGPGLRNAMLAIGIVYAPRFMRLVRASALGIRQENYVMAARSIGAGHTWVIVRHVLPNLLSPLIVQITVMFGTAILFEASLSFLGLGVQPPEPSWGAILGRAFPYMSRSPVIVLFVGVLLSAVILAINLLGDELRDTLTPERRGKA